MGYQRLYGGVYLLDGAGPCLRNVQRLDELAIPMISCMQNTGLQVDLDHFARMQITLTDDMEKITETVRDMTGYYINCDSGEQVSDLLFKKLGLKQARPKMTTSGDRESVADEVLTAIQHDHPVVPKLQEFKEFSKLRGTYVEPMPKLARRVGFGEWRMFPNLTHTRVPSGRLACKSPNLLAMPTRTERGRDIRKGFIAAEGWKIVSVDFSQIEPRIAAHRSEDPALLKVYRNDEDVYSDFALAAFRLPDKRYKSESGKWIYPGVEVMEHRRPCKTCVLAALYAVTNVGLLEQMPIVCKNCNKEATKHDCGRFTSLWNENNCQDLLNAFFMKYPGLVRMMKLDHATARKHAMMWDLFGRVLHVTAVRSVLDWVVSAALREVGNYPMQAPGAGFLKLGLAQVYNDAVEWGMLNDVVRFLLPVHDELLSEVRSDMAEEFGNHTAFRFSTVAKLLVPIKAGVAMADSWGTVDK